MNESATSSYGSQGMYVCIGLTLTGGLCGWLTVVQLVDDGVTTVTHGITGIPMEGTIPCEEIVPKLCSGLPRGEKSYPDDMKTGIPL
ncbi:hypothetical protein L1987_22767 [Smallanthus sonchifolius]|uniref:Uncharacterized protein n=1 Tax=Smallanthus sonchifolius TaxID=185202 RepID=A0ACB9IH79_9ASTR|nr:hypothetical protein L1987_22767 [Smallanthus sonchifolius]